MAAARGSRPAPPLPDDPLVSILMPTYHRPHTIFRTVEQIVEQTYPRWELLVINNARKGDYQFDDPRIRVYRHAARASASYARNVGLRHATGDLLCYFDDDDDVCPEYLERFVAAFRQHPNAMMARCQMYRQNGTRNFGHSTPSSCVRRQFATPTWGTGFFHDISYWSEIMAVNGWTEAGGQVALIPEVLVRARGDPRGGLRRGRL